MQELFWVAGLMLLVGAAAAVQFVPWPDLIMSGNNLMLGSAAVGVPLELVYFGGLAAALRFNGEVPRGWYWRSFEHHHLLTRGQRLVLLPFFYTGALCFLAIVLGMVVVGLGMFSAVKG